MADFTSSWVGHLPHTLAMNGFQVVGMSRKQAAEWQRQIFMEQYIMANDGIAKSKGVPSNDFGSMVLEEVRNGASTAQVIQVVVAKKRSDGFDGSPYEESEEQLSLRRVPLQRGLSYEPRNDVPITERLLTLNNSLSLII